jgi:hypothetical protein
LIIKIWKLIYSYCCDLHWQSVNILFHSSWRQWFRNGTNRLARIFKSDSSDYSHRSDSDYKHQSDSSDWNHQSDSTDANRESDSTEKSDSFELLHFIICCLSANATIVACRYFPHLSHCILSANATIVTCRYFPEHTWSGGEPGEVVRRTHRVFYVQLALVPRFRTSNFCGLQSYPSTWNLMKANNMG